MVDTIPPTGQSCGKGEGNAVLTVRAIRTDDLYLVGLLAVGLVPPAVGGGVGWAFGWSPALGFGMLVGFLAPAIPTRLGVRVRRTITVAGGPLPPERHQFLSPTLRRLLVRYLLDVGPP